MGKKKREKRIFLYLTPSAHKMAQLVAALSTGKGTWGHVRRLVETGNWEKVFLLSNSFGKENYTVDEKTELVVLENLKPLKELVVDIQEALKNKLSGDVAVNLISGSGKEHMALISVLHKMGIKYRLVAITKEGIEDI